MQLEPLLWIVLPLAVSIGTGVLVWILMEARLSAALARERCALVEARAIIANQDSAFAERMKAVEEVARAKTIDSVLAEVRVEQRQYLRAGPQPALVLQERVCFRGIPLSPWTQQVIAGVHHEEIHQLLAPEFVDLERAERPVRRLNSVR